MLIKKFMCEKNGNIVIGIVVGQRDRKKKCTMKVFGNFCPVFMMTKSDRNFTKTNTVKCFK